MNPQSHRYAADPNVAAVAALIGDPGRAAMLLALLDGCELPATALACRASVTPQAATAHLKKLVDANLLVVRNSGRHRLFALASSEVGTTLEMLAAIAPNRPIVALSQNSAMARLREARSCYDHLAGRLGVALTDRLIARGMLRLEGASFAVTPRGKRFFSDLDVDLDAWRSARRSFSRACFDWTERRPHLAGSLGASLRALFLARGWVARNSNDRSLKVTSRGQTALLEHFDLHF